MDAGGNFLVINESIIELPITLKEKYKIPASFIAKEIQILLSDFQNNHKINSTDFEKLLLAQPLRDKFIDFIKNYTDERFSRYLLRQAIEFRKNGELEVLCEDLLMFSYFASKNKSTKDLDLIMEAKLADFDTWCGFDGEMIFYPLGYAETLNYLSQNQDKFGAKPVQYYHSAFSEDYLSEIQERAFWYLY